MRPLVMWGQSFSDIALITINSTNSMSPKTYPVRVNDAVTIEIAAVDQGVETRVDAGDVLDFQQVSDSVEAIAESLMGAFKKVKPQKATGSFG